MKPQEVLSKDGYELWEFLSQQNFKDIDELERRMVNLGFNFQLALTELRGHGILDEDSDSSKIKLVEPYLGYTREGWVDQWLHGQVLDIFVLSYDAQELWFLLKIDSGDLEYLPYDASTKGWNLEKAIGELRNHGILDESNPKILRALPDFGFYKR